MSTNPRITSIPLGIREINDYRIYPLSMADEFAVTDIISKAAEDFIALENAGKTDEATAVKLVIDLIKDNLERVIAMVTDEDNRPTLADMDNTQFSELVDLIYVMNFEETIKNFQSLVEKVKGSFLSTRPLPQSSEEVVTD